MLWENVMENCPFMREMIENKIFEEVNKKDNEIAELKSTIEDLTTTILMGGQE